MSSYHGADAAWDGGPPGAEAEYAGQRPPLPPPAPGMPTTDPWTGVSYSQYGATPAYNYQAYGAAAAAAGFSYNFNSGYYQQQYGKYPDATAFAMQTASYENPSGSARSSRSKTRSSSPSDKKERDNSYEKKRNRRSRSKSSRRKKYSSSDRSSSRSYSRSPHKKEKKKRSLSSESDRSYRKKSRKSRGRDSTSPRDSKGSSSARTPSIERSISKSPVLKKKKKNKKSHSSKDKRQWKVDTPPRKKKDSLKSPKRKIKIERSSLTPPRVYKLKECRSDSGSRDNSLTPPKSYARNPSTSKSQSRSPSPKSSKHKRSHSRTSRSYSRSRSLTPRRSHSKSKRKNKKKYKGHSKSRRSKSRGRASVSHSGSKSRSRSRSDGGTPSDDERRGQFTVADRKRFWKEHKYRQQIEEESKTPPREIKPPPGVVDVTCVEDIEYRDPPEVEGPNFAEMLPPPDQVVVASGSKSKPLAVPIKNDGSFLEMFKKMQEVTKKVEESEKKPEIKKPVLPFIGKRRGGRVLKTGLVKKAKAIEEQTADNAPKDAWSLYMQEVKKYKETSCEEERKTRPLVK